MKRKNKDYFLSAGMLLLLLGALQSSAYGLGGQETPAFRVTGRIWLFLQPEEEIREALERRLAEASAQLTPRARQRRLKNLGPSVVRECDLPPADERLEAIERTGCRVVRVVRYVRAVVVEGEPQAISKAKSLSFVREVKPVMAFAAASRDELDDSFERRSESSRPSIHFDKFHDARASNADYGDALRQNLMVNVPAVHARGLHGEGVLIGVQDTGFEIRRHRAFRDIEVLATYDFLNGNENVFDEGDEGDAQHGTRVLSVIAGLDTGNYIGVAPKAQFVLTKTENTESETPIEEDIWVEGLWFHDSLGVDLLSSSLSYRDWYDYEDYDGQTAVTSLAADSAFAAGLVIVNSMGNTGLAGYPRNKMGAPADARGVISVGGVNRDSSRWQSASQGPTFDGRVKPDVVAQSSLVFTVSTINNSSYAGRSGTSFSAPTVAGVAALILQANRGLTSSQVMEIVHRTSSSGDDPDTLTGYGILDALGAVLMAEEMSAQDQPPPITHQLIRLYPNPTNGMAVIIGVDFGRGGLDVKDMNGRVLQQNLTGGLVNLTDYPAGSYWVGSSRDGWRRLILVR